MAARGAAVPIPTDVITAPYFGADAPATAKSASEVGVEEMIFDIGADTAKTLADLLKTAGTIVWNGPVGVFEFPQFAAGTKTVSNAIADSAAFSIAGGGDTIAAINQFGITDKVNYISTAGGAFLEFLEGKALPAVEALKARA